MPLSNILILCAIVFAFLIFATVLAWGDFYSHGASGKSDKQSKSQPAEKNGIKNAA